MLRVHQHTPNDRSPSTEGAGGIAIHDRSSRQRVAVFDGIHPIGDFHVWPLGGDRFVTLTGRGELLGWDLSREALRERACRLAGRDLTIEEWDTYLSGEDVRSTCEAATAGT